MLNSGMFCPCCNHELEFDDHVEDQAGFSYARSYMCMNEDCEKGCYQYVPYPEWEKNADVIRRAYIRGDVTAHVEHLYHGLTYKGMKFTIKAIAHDRDGYPIRKVDINTTFAAKYGTGITPFLSEADRDMAAIAADTESVLRMCDTYSIRVITGL